MDTRIAGRTTAPDPVTLEVLRAAFTANLDEIELTLCRTAHSSTIYEVHDMCAGWVDPEGNCIAQGRHGLPIFMSDLGSSIRRGIELYRAEGFQPGDIFITNHAESCGQHLSNVVVYAPVMHAGAVIAFTACRAHWNDVGGKAPGSYATDSTEIFQEGVQLDNLRVARSGREDAGTLRTITANVRFPDMAIGDLRAQITACRLGERRFLDLVGKYGIDVIQQGIQALWNQSEQRARAVVARIPDGVYRASAWLDNDGVELDRRLDVQVAVTVAGSDMTVDFTGTAAQAKGPLNCGAAGALAAARVAFKCITAPATTGDEGSFRPLKMIVPPGTFISARSPAPLSLWSSMLPTVIECVLTALAPALPEQIPAAHHGAIPTCFFVRPASPGKPGFVHADPFPCGWGARHDGDGPVTLKSYIHGDTFKIPAELEELNYPFRVTAYGLRTDSGGAGRFRGGPGIDRSFEVLEDLYITTCMERATLPAWGLFGGGPSVSSVVEITYPDGRTELVHKATMKHLPAGTRMTVHTGGGGGHGPAFAREPWRVAQDVERGIVSRAAALRDYGVVFSDEGTIEIDMTATQQLRASHHPG